ncbi:B12-binding domain-containing radical SAM protein [Candidatus Omnitrophota bacterium]
MHKDKRLILEGKTKEYKTPKNILLLNPGSPGIMMRGLIRERPTQFGFCWPSVDLILISGVLNEKGYHLSYTDASVDGMSSEQVLKQIKNENIDVVVSLFSRLSQENDIVFLKELKKGKPSLVMVILPMINHVLNPEKAVDFLNTHDWLDATVLSVINNDLDQYLKGEYREGLVGICYKDNGQVHLGVKKDIECNDAVLPIPRHDLFKNKKYFLPQSRKLYATTTMMQFGCSFKCDFCLDRKAYPKVWCRSPENMLEEFEAIASYGFNEVYIRDLTFGINRSRVERFCELLIEKKVPLSWVCTTRIDLVDFEFLSLMKKAGCHCIEFGIESGIDATKELHQKGIKNAQIKQVFDDCRRLGIETTMFVMIGFPEESMEDMKKSLQFCFDLKGDFLALNIANVLPGTELERILIDKEKQTKGNADGLKKLSYDKQNLSHPTISDEEMNELYRKTIIRFYFRLSFILNRFLKLRSLGAVLKVLSIGVFVIKSALFKAKEKRI